MEQLKKWILKIGIPIIVLICLGILIVVYYYFRTSPETIVVVPGPLPSGLSSAITQEQLTDYLLASLLNIRVTVNSASTTDAWSSQTTIGIQEVLSKGPVFVPSQISLPLFDQKIHQVNLEMLREFGVYLRAKRFIWLEATGATIDHIQLLALLQEGPGSPTRYSWKVPGCSVLERCMDELAEGILTDLSPRTLVSYELRKGSQTAFRNVVQVYESGRIQTADLGPSDFLAWGNGLLGTKEYDQAIQKYQKALTLKQDSRFCEPYDLLGRAHLLKYINEHQIEELDAAETAYRQAITCNPNDPVAHCNLGNVLIRKWVAGGKLDKQMVQDAIMYSQQALAEDPGLAEAAVNVGYLQYMDGQRQQALDYFRKISQSFTPNSALFLNFGFLLYKEYLQGRTELLREAINETLRAWNLDASSYIAANNLGFYYYESEDLPDAVRYWKEAYLLNPNDSDIVAGLALGLFKSGQEDEGVERYREAMSLDPKIESAQYLQQTHLWSNKAARDVIPLLLAVRGGQTPGKNQRIKDR